LALHLLSVIPGGEPAHSLGKGTLTTQLRREMKKAVFAMIRWMKSFLAFQLICGSLLYAQDQEAVPQTVTEAVQNAASVIPEFVSSPTPLAEAAAPAVSTLNSGDQAWMLACAAFVLLMTPGLAFFYGGLVGRKNILSILMQCFMSMSVVTVLWVVVGYSIAFSGTEIAGGFCGDPMTHFLLKDVKTDASFEPVAGVKLGLSQQMFMVFQMMFAIITPALIVGAFAERMKFTAFTLFIALWSLMVYSPVAHWVWYGPTHPIFGLGSFNAKDAVPEGALDFAGGTVVHINAGIAALVACLIIGPRRGFPKQINPPHNLPFAVLGAGLLWFGWFGFNGGSAFGATPQAVQAFVTTQVAVSYTHLTLPTT
jgi:Amt family ammonium transporter